MENYKKLSLFLLGFYIYCRSYAQNEISGVNSGLLYLSKFGYLDPSVVNPKSEALLDHKSLSEAIREFQAFAGINVTGEMDPDTIRMMNTPRCGVKDKVGYGSKARKKRYALQGSRWKPRNLTYRVTKYPKRLTRRDVDVEISKAFKVWEEVTELKFTNAEFIKKGKVHIEIRFETGEHGDGDAFDGKGGTLAHAYFPIYGGDAHFDDSEHWTIDRYTGTNLFLVAAHEFGHSLGLSHSDVSASLMAPFYKGYNSDPFKLDVDDITAIQSLYGEKEVKLGSPDVTNNAPAEPEVPRTDSELCGRAFDTILNIKGETFVFKGDYYWKLTEDSIAKGFPKKISQTFKNLPNKLDAAFTYTNNKTYYFKDNLYYRFNGDVMDKGYPKLISTGFKGIPNSVDVAFVWGGNGKIYFFKNRQYWKFDPAKTQPVSDAYPKDIYLWDGLPYQIDGALKYTNGYTYFFKNGKYWRFNDRQFAVDLDKSQPYPRDAGYWWFGCPSSGSQVASTNVNEQPNDYGEVAEEDSFNGNAYDDYIYEDNYIHPKTISYLKSDANSLGHLVHVTCLLVPILSKLLL